MFLKGVSNTVWNLNLLAVQLILLNMAQDPAADIVKKGQLKYRASKVKGTSGSSAQGVSVCHGVCMGITNQGFVMS